MLVGNPAFAGMFKFSIQHPISSIYLNKTFPESGKTSLFNILRCIMPGQDYKFMKKTLEIINQMQDEEVFKRYAIAGGIAAIFYIEPITTFDLDIFIVLDSDNKNGLVSLSPIYEWLGKRGYKTQKEQIIIEGVPVQFIPVYNELTQDAVKNACKMKYKNITTSVLKKEYLFAIMLQTNRPKDIDRMIKFIEQTNMSVTELNKILNKHNLYNSFRDFKKKYYEK